MGLVAPFKKAAASTTTPPMNIVVPMVWSIAISNRSVVLPAETEENGMLDSILARISPLRLFSFRWTIGCGSARYVLLSLSIMAKERSAILVVVESTI